MSNREEITELFKKRSEFLQREDAVEIMNFKNLIFY